MITLADSVLMQIQRMIPNKIGLKPTCLMVSLERPAPIRNSVNNIPTLANPNDLCVEMSPLRRVGSDDHGDNVEENKVKEWIFLIWCLFLYYRRRRRSMKPG